MIKRILFIACAMATLAVPAKTFQAGDHFSISLPAEWQEVPASFMVDYAERMRRSLNWDKALKYDYTYHVGELRNLTPNYPYITVEVLDQGRMPSSWMRAKEQSGDVVYDQKNRVLWATISRTNGVQNIQARVALKQTEIGLLRFTGCTLEEDYEEFIPIFEGTIEGLQVNDDIRFRTRFLEDLPPINGVDIGQVVRWIIEGIAVGAVLWGLYALIRRGIAQLRARNQ